MLTWLYKFYTNLAPRVKIALAIAATLICGLLLTRYVFGLGASGALWRWTKGHLSVVLVILLVILIASLGIASFLYLKRKNLPSINSLINEIFIKRWKLWFIAFLIVYFLVFTAIGYWKHLNIQTSLFDFGLEQQVVWNTANGRLFEASVEVNNYMGDHVSPIILLPALVYKFFPGALTIFVLQTLAIVIGIVGVGLLSRKLILANYHKGNLKFVNRGRVLIVLLTLAYAFHWGTTGSLIFDYHPVVFAIPFAVWAIYFDLTGNGTRKNKLIVTLLFLLATLAKEDVGMFVVGYGLVKALFMKDRWGWIWAVTGGVISILGLFVIIPAVRQAPSDTLDRYLELGSSTGEVIKTVLFKPLVMFEYLNNYGRIGYLVKLLAPFLFIPLLRPRYWLLFLPNLVINILSVTYSQHSVLVHYDGLIVVGIWLASLLSIQDWLKLRNGRLSRKGKVKSSLVESILNWQWPILWGGMILFFGVVSPVWKDFLETPLRLETRESMQAFIRTIPSDAAIMADNSAGGQLGEFYNLKLYFPNWYGQWPYDTSHFNYIVIDKYRHPDVEMQNQLEIDIQKGFELVYEQGGIVIYHRK